ncbi:ComEA family DNA-binding protein [Alkalicoccus luteus]|uniref:Helix-hairpin-helix DNA-binding motif class 1 domain-containing protein n=1 Tax=Alkalicoccus luteus TaxID=1237094 RepID=A0A969TXK8_9BACI|nr:helix-hairpin-helix domain-containing protein [Alkalicoccus luteus]NJP38319.1 hypothetical protein [Alkalicoccus luteus]
MLKKIIAFLTAAGAAYKFFPAVRRSLLNWLEDEPVKAPGKEEADSNVQEEDSAPAEEKEQPAESESDGGAEAAEEEPENDAASDSEPEEDSEVPQEDEQSESESKAEADEEDDEVLIHPNRTYEEELLQIPGVGSELAASFIRERKENGNFESIDELIRVKGIGAKKLEELRRYFTMEDA